MSDISVHEILLEDYLINGINNTVSRVYRVSLGELINAKDRKTLKPDEKIHDRTKSGSIGFMDLATIDELVPKEGARLYPNPQGIPYLKYRYSEKDYECVRALVILRIGIEPEHRGKGYARLLKQRAEEIATERGLDVVIGSSILSEIMRELDIKLGYTLYDSGWNAIKRLNK